jgi:hypothetical protein
MPGLEPGDIIVIARPDDPLVRHELVILEMEHRFGIMKFAQAHSIAWTQSLALEPENDMIFLGSQYFKIVETKKGAALDLLVA